ncbi:MAG: alpha-1,2-fucosyltransferase [Lachnospiraceae bacterium]|nr:alpha-1,2-fucosyltransferase [Lachnospiraceae bacterium]
MRIQQLSGGFANQVFQYVFMRYGELSDPKQDWYLDDSDFYINKKYNGYELEKVFGVKPKLLSRCYEAAKWDSMIEQKKNGKSIPQILKDDGNDIIMYADNDDYKKDNAFDGEVYRMLPEGGFYPDIVKIDKPIVYYHGDWVEKNWFDSYREQMLEELRFPEIKSKQALKYKDMILKGMSVGMHIRRGDFVKMGIQLGADYYFKALKDLSEHFKNFTVYVFSDDLYWCNQHVNQLGLNFAHKIEYISGNMGNESYVDLQLMSMCKVVIMANSAFSFLAGLMDTRLEYFIDPWTGEWGK